MSILTWFFYLWLAFAVGGTFVWFAGVLAAQRHDALMAKLIAERKQREQQQ